MARDTGPGPQAAPPVANDDTYVTDDATTITGNVLGNDTPGDLPLAVTAVNGSAAAVGLQIILASGALLRVNADGSFTYNPNGAFNSLPTTNDVFTYTVSGGDTGSVTVTVSDGEIFGTGGPDTLNGTNGDDVILALGGNDTVNGLDGNDSINGGIGADSMNGGGGNDLYYVDDALDTVNEVAGEGYDIIVSTVNYTLAAGTSVEELTTEGLGVVLTGNDSANILRGYRLRGGGGNDTLYGQPSPSDGDLRGGAGDDTYFIPSGGYSETELIGEGHDVIMLSGFSVLTFFLSAGAAIEEIRALFADQRIQAHGNEFAQTFYGSDGDDFFRGNGGPDVYYGGLGQDRYYLTDELDTIVELAGQGTDDLVYVRFNYVLPEHLENVFAEADSLTLTGNTGNNRLRGAGGSNLLFGLEGNDWLEGQADNDTLYGGIGNDRLEGGDGDDLMVGGTGDDTYIVSGNDIVVEDDPNGGFDTLRAPGSYQLAANQYIEHLVGAGTLIGNQITQYILGSDGSDWLDGGVGGADTLEGRNGSDTYIVDTDDIIIESGFGSGGNDTIYARSNYTLAAGQEIEVLSAYSIANQGALDLTGNERRNTLVGTNGNNVLNGGGEVDVLNGFAGDDTFVVTAGDLVFEGANEGNDVVYATENYTLTANSFVETLSAFSIANQGALNLTGNNRNNVLVGTNGANTLNGGGGVDVLNGFAGDDVFIVDSDDIVFDDAVGAAGGFDTVYALTSYTLTAGQQIELLSAFSIGWTHALDLTGNGANNTLVGSNGANTLDGKGGNDYLVAFGGADNFAFTSALNATTNVDRIEGFQTGVDEILLDDAVFAGLAAGALNPNAFVVGSAALDADDRIIYNQATAQLFFDADGSGSGAAVLFAVMVGTPTLSASDFTVI